jgi:hypothetical protein
VGNGRRSARGNAALATPTSCASSTPTLPRSGSASTPERRAPHLRRVPDVATEPPDPVLRPAEPDQITRKKTDTFIADWVAGGPEYKERVRLAREREAMRAREQRRPPRPTGLVAVPARSRTHSCLARAAWASCRLGLPGREPRYGKTPGAVGVAGGGDDPRALRGGGRAAARRRTAGVPHVVPHLGQHGRPPGRAPPLRWGDVTGTATGHVYRCGGRSPSPVCSRSRRRRAPSGRPQSDRCWSAGEPLDGHNMVSRHFRPTLKKAGLGRDLRNQGGGRRTGVTGRCAYGYEVQPVACGCETTHWPFSKEAVIEDAPQMHSRSSAECRTLEAPAEAAQAAITKSMPSVATSFLICPRFTSSRLLNGQKGPEPRPPTCTQDRPGPWRSQWAIRLKSRPERPRQDAGSERTPAALIGGWGAADYFPNTGQAIRPAIKDLEGEPASVRQAEGVRGDATPVRWRTAPTGARCSPSSVAARRPSARPRTMR